MIYIQPINVRLGSEKDEDVLYIMRGTGEVVQQFKEDIVIASPDYIVNFGNGSVLSPYKPKTKAIKTSFIKLNEVALSELDCNECYKILPYIAYMTGRISWDNGKPIRNMTDFMKILGVGKNKITLVMKKLIDEDVIHKHTDNGVYYTFNPFIALRGPKCYMELYEDFENSKWRQVNTKE